MKKLVLLLAMLIAMNAYAGNQWRQGGTEKSIAGSESPSDIDEVSYENIVAPNERLLSNYQEGAKISYSSATTISISAGEVMLSNSGGTVRLMQQNTSAKTATFSDIDTGAEEASKTYYVYAYQETVADTDFDIIISLSSSAPSGATYYARLGSFYNNSDGDIEQIDNDSAQPISSYDSDWFAVATDTSYQKTHSLGTSKLHATLWFSTTGVNANAQVIAYDTRINTDNNKISTTGLRIDSPTTITIHTGNEHVAHIMNFSIGEISEQTSGYYRLLLTAIE